MKRDCSQKFISSIWLVPVICMMASACANANTNDYTVHIVEPAVNNHMILEDGPLPPVCKEATAIEISACRGEYEPASFVVTASHALNEVRVEVDPVIGPSISWPKDAIDVRVVKKIHRRVFGVSSVIPSLLVHDENFITTETAPVEPDTNNEQFNDAGFLIASEMKQSFNVANGELRDTLDLQPVSINKRKQFWITVHIPDYAYPGTYTTTLRIVPGNAAPTELTLRINVHPFTLLPPMTEHSIYYPVVLVPEGAEDWSQGKQTGGGPCITPSQYIAECKNMVAHGITNPNIYGGVGINPDDTLDYSHIEKILALREQAGIAKGQPLYLTSAAAEPVSRPLTDAEKEQRIAIVKEVMAWGKQRGYPDIHWAGLDEAWGEWLASEKDSFQAINDGGGKVFAATGIQFYDLVGDTLRKPVLMSPLLGRLQAAAKQYPSDQLIQHADDIAKGASLDLMAQGDIYRKNIDSVHRAGNKIFVYMHPPAGVPLPQLQRRAEGLGLWRIGFDGSMNWSYSHIKFGDKPIDQNLFSSKVMRVKGGVLDTLHWEGHREGIDDIRYLTTLMDTLARARGRFPGNSLIRETENWLSNIDVFEGNLDAIRQEMALRIIALQGLGYKAISPEETLESINNINQVRIINFPQPWRFKLVPVDEKTFLGPNPPEIDMGLQEKWFDPAHDDSHWDTMRTDTKEQGWGQETGYGWYRIELPLSAEDAKGKFAYLHFGACDEDAWIYINGKQVFKHTLASTGLLPEQLWLMPFIVPLGEIELTGNDLMTVRIKNTQDMGGIWRPVRLIVSHEKLTKQQVEALILLKATQHLPQRLP